LMSTGCKSSHNGFLDVSRSIYSATDTQIMSSSGFRKPHLDDMTLNVLRYSLVISSRMWKWHSVEHRQLTRAFSRVSATLANSLATTDILFHFINGININQSSYYNIN